MVRQGRSSAGFIFRPTGAVTHWPLPHWLACLPGRALVKVRRGHSPGFRLISTSPTPVHHLNEHDAMLTRERNRRSVRRVESKSQPGEFVILRGQTQIRHSPISRRSLLYMALQRLTLERRQFQDGGTNGVWKNKESAFTFFGRAI